MGKLQSDLLVKFFCGLVKMTLGLVHSSYSLPKGKAVPVAFFSPCSCWSRFKSLVSLVVSPVSNVQGQLCHVTCGRERNRLNHARMSLIQSRRPEKKAKKIQSCPENSHESWSMIPRHFPLSNPMILKVFPKTFPKNFSHQKTKHCKFPERKEKGVGKVKKSERRGKKRKQKVQVKTAVSLLNFKTISKFCFWFCEKHEWIIALSFTNNPTIMLWSISELFQRENLMECLAIW